MNKQSPKNRCNSCGKPTLYQGIMLPGTTIYCQRCGERLEKGKL